jgi:leucyl-tRNA synthetase
VQVNGKLRGRVTVPADGSDDQSGDAALADPPVAAHIAGRTVVKVIVAKGKLVSVVIR